MRLKKITEADKYQIDLIFFLYTSYLESACIREGKPLTDLIYHFERLEELKSKCKREK